MKYDITKKSNRFAQRTLADFSKAMFDLLVEKPFEEITVNELCKTSNYPRATFYNYFEDIYDILDYCWYCLAKEIRLEDCVNMEPEIALYVYSDRFYDFMISKKKDFDAITRHNPIDGKMTTSFQNYVKKQIYAVMTSCSEKVKHNRFQEHPVPYELIASHYSNTILLVFEWSFLKNKSTSKEDTINYLRVLTGWKRNLSPMARRRLW